MPLLLFIITGRLIDGQTTLSKDDLFNMVRFGAEHVLASQPSEITDDDIDAILLKGEHKVSVKILLLDKIFSLPRVISFIARID